MSIISVQNEILQKIKKTNKIHLKISKNIVQLTLLRFNSKNENNVINEKKKDEMKEQRKNNGIKND